MLPPSGGNPRLRGPDVPELLRLSLEALARHKLRTFLGVTGIVIGVAAVTAMLSVGEGARREVIRQVELLGLNNVVLRPVPVQAGREGPSGRPARLSFDDVDRLRVLVPISAAWSPLIERFANLDGPAGSAGTNVLGVAPDYQRIMQLKAAQGRLLAVLDVDHDQRVCVLGSSVVKALYGSANPIGRSLRIDSDSYGVVGVLETRASPGTSGGTLSPRDLNKAVLVPGRRGTFLGQPSSINELWMQVPNDGGLPVAEAGAVAAHALHQLHQDDAGFELLIPQDLLQQRLSTQRTFNIVLGSVAVLSLLVGGIGIMNMMLASVLERTSEIGLRRTVGATHWSITCQFLLESTLMTTAGGVLGVAVGAFASVVVTRYAGWPSYVSLWAVGASLLVAGGVGLFFGTYPARRAARLEPVEAVRYE